MSSGDHVDVPETFHRVAKHGIWRENRAYVRLAGAFGEVAARPERELLALDGLQFRPTGKTATELAK